MSNLKRFIPPVNICPHCGSEKGYYVIKQAYGTCEQLYNFDGIQLNDNTKESKILFGGGKYAYCIDCNKKIFSINF